MFIYIHIYVVKGCRIKRSGKGGSGYDSLLFRLLVIHYWWENKARSPTFVRSDLVTFDRETRLVFASSPFLLFYLFTTLLVSLLN